MRRYLDLGVGLFLLCGVTLLAATASASALIAVEGTLEAFWRTTYDILVRPSGSRSPIEQKYDVLEANYLPQIDSAISYEQYEIIKAIPGVEIAAPVAMLGYRNEGVVPYDVPDPSQPGVYRFDFILREDQGALATTRHDRVYIYKGAVDTSAVPQLQGLVVNRPVYTVDYPISLLMAAIDPVQESKLVGLDQAVTRGRYFRESERMAIGIFESPLGTSTDIRDVPVLVNARPYHGFTIENRLSRVRLPDGVTSLPQIVEAGGAEFLDTLSTEVLYQFRANSRDVYPEIIEQILEPYRPYATIVHEGLYDTWRAMRRGYDEVQPPFPYEGLALRVEIPPPPDVLAPTTDVTFVVNGIGVYDLERIPRPADINRVPLEIYLPPVVRLVYNEDAHPIDPPREFRPGPRPGSYVLSPPLILTTLEAARLITGDDCASCISAIRVRVALEGCPGDYLSCPLTPENQRKIETVASEIARLTGLDVDIVVGSSPTRVLVHIPGVGWVEEQWIQKNVTLTYKERVQLGHLLLLGTLLVVGALFTLDLAWAEVVARRRLIALQKALGWRSRTVFRQVLGEVLLAATPAAALGALAARGLSALFGWQPLPLSWLVGVPLVVVALALVGGLYPARAAARIPPALGVRPGEPFPGGAGRRASRQGGLLTYAWQGLGRRRSRTALGALTAALSAALLVLMLAVTVDRQGALSGTLLGEFILVRLEAHHYALVVMGFLLAGLSLGNSLLAAVLERRREIGVLKAVGWRTGTVVRLFLAEGALLGLMGGAAGALAGAGAFVGLYRTLPLSLAWIMAVGVALPVSVGMLVALYPAQMAARVPPAEVVRYE